MLANVLGVTHLANTLYCQSELLAPWGLAIHNPHKTTLHLVRRGSCWLRVGDQKRPIQLVAGDAVLLAQGLSHTISHQPGGEAQPWDQALDQMRLRVEAAGPAARQDATLLLCAAYAFEDDADHPLLSLLPAFIHLNMEQGQGAPAFQSLIQLLAEEAQQRLPGSSILMPRMIDSLFVYVLRAWLERQPEGTAGWFGALRDTQVGRAIALIHERPHLKWTVAGLGKEIGLSRAAFARRFQELVGESPLAYLTRWRMSVAAKLLRSSDDTLDRIATRVGYDSSAAFGKAFQRTHRMPPGHYRSDWASRFPGNPWSADASNPLYSRQG
ncbi:MAG: AraC family transcriptional regulator [Acidobacteria bacterium]|nr:AraC family transcriptional regulator [Acidobacteriota bacterium]MBI3489846.1 AraC family transcriptional regulator [Acidobacteriota bacterium]